MLSYLIHFYLIFEWIPSLRHNIYPLLCFFNLKNCLGPFLLHLPSCQNSRRTKVLQLNSISWNSLDDRALRNTIGLPKMITAVKNIGLGNDQSFNLPIIYIHISQLLRTTMADWGFILIFPCHSPPWPWWKALKHMPIIAHIVWATSCKNRTQHLSHCRTKWRLPWHPTQSSLLSAWLRLQNCNLLSSQTT